MDSLLESLKNLGPGRLIMMGVTFFGLIIFFVFIAVRSSAPSLSLLYGDLSTSDATEISAKLDNANVPYSLSEDGTKVSVPHKDIAKARMLLAAEGLPRKGSMGYELFDQKQSFGDTSFKQNLNALRALEGELARTISTIDQVRSARVHLVLPARELFSRERQPASASVFLNLRNAGNIGQEQIGAIRQLVAAAVPQLKPGHVAIIDQGGNLLARGEDGSGTDSLARSTDDMRKNYETRLKMSVEDIVGRIVGYDKVRATIAANMNFDTINRASESYNPDGQVVRSVQSVTEENSDTTASENGNGAVTVQNNLPGLPAAGGEQSGSKNNRTEETTNYEITKTTETLVREGGQVEKLSVAVLVDGSYVPDTSVQKPKDAPADWAPPRKYQPRSADELAQITALVRSAVGYDESRGDSVTVSNMQFAETDMFDAGPVKDDNILGFPKSDLLGVAETLALSLVAILVILLVLRPLAMHFAAAARQPRAPSGDGTDMPLLTGGPAQPQLAGPGTTGMISGPSELESMIDMSSVEGKVKASSVQKISDLVTNHPNETVSVIRQWMSQES
ncbi:MAG TPA: flagellar basal-body MS-ring/collar protein FliF [Patescibacteria group bacterium]|nr:flagellar basal-body MS-ring/collar protein FliF [Patescibacteria group bacterium]